MICLAIAIMGTAYLSISRMPKKFAFFLEHAVQCNLENSAANDKLTPSFLFLKKLKVFHVLKYSVEPDKLKDKIYEKFIQIIRDC